jgi:hypothetical protein
MRTELFGGDKLVGNNIAQGLFFNAKDIIQLPQICQLYQRFLLLSAAFEN